MKIRDEWICPKCGFVGVDDYDDSTQIGYMSSCECYLTLKEYKAIKHRITKK